MPSPEQPKCRQAVESDLEDIVEMAKKFHQQSIWRESLFDENKVRSMAHVLLGLGGIFVNSAGGFIAGSLQPLIFSSTTFVAVELAWFAPNGGGRELREAFEEWARAQGASIIQVCLLGDENFDKNHANISANGYALAELQYVKVL